MTGRRPAAPFGRRASAVRGVLAASARYAAGNAGEMGWRDAVAFPAAVAAALAVAALAPDARSGDGVFGSSPHAPVGARDPE